MSEDKSVHYPNFGADPTPDSALDSDSAGVAGVIFLDGRRVVAHPSAAAEALAARFREIAERQEQYKAEHGHYPPPSPWVRWKSTQRRFALALDILRKAGFPDAWDRASDIADSTDTPDQAVERAQHLAATHEADTHEEGNDD